jgi:hypothetical protein
MTPLEVAIKAYYHPGGVVTAARVVPGLRVSDGVINRVVDCYQDAGRLVCEECHFTIRAKRVKDPYGSGFFHPSCLSKRYGRGAQSSAVAQSAPAHPSPVQVPPPQSTRVIGTLAGIACPINQPSHMRHRDGFDYMEKIDWHAFDASLARRSQTLRVNHEGADIGGTFRYLDIDAGFLKFRFDVLDSLHGQDVLRRARARQFTGVSIAHATYGRKMDGYTEVVTEADLQHIALLAGGRPAWFDTAVWLEA